MPTNTGRVRAGRWMSGGELSCSSVKPGLCGADLPSLMDYTPYMISTSHQAQQRDLCDCTLINDHFVLLFNRTVKQLFVDLKSGAAGEQGEALKAAIKHIN